MLVIRLNLCINVEYIKLSTLSTDTYFKPTLYSTLHEDLLCAFSINYPPFCIVWAKMVNCSCTVHVHSSDGVCCTVWEYETIHVGSRSSRNGQWRLCLRTARSWGKTLYRFRFNIQCFVDFFLTIRTYLGSNIWYMFCVCVQRLLTLLENRKCL